MIFILRIGMIIYSGFCNGGLLGIYEYLKETGAIIFKISDLMNKFLIFYDGDGILTHIFSYPITYLIVGMLLYFFCTKNTIFGKILYKVVNKVITPLLNIINSLIFK